LPDSKYAHHWKLRDLSSLHLLLVYFKKIAQV
jgi:hypothetical protein